MGWAGKSAFPMLGRAFLPLAEVEAAKAQGSRGLCQGSSDPF